ncbi:cobalamin biosynthesis protein, partial [Dysgonomonas sp. Marseille-P4677]|uniref:cobalamin biosynthesis protein n=1 Tax=Dysgonomonas sp. Marseille-P4677 TaxID=2364790 RepID=UPI0019133B7A
MDISCLYILLPLFLGWLADQLIGDPSWLPHPIVAMGKVIAWGEKMLNRGKDRLLKGGLFSIVLILSSFFLVYFIEKGLNAIHPF